MQSWSALWDNEHVDYFGVYNETELSCPPVSPLPPLDAVCDGALMEASLLPSCLRGISKAKIQCGLLLHTAKEWHIPCWSEICQQPRIVLLSLRNQGFQGPNTSSSTESCCFYRCCWNGPRTNSYSFAPMGVSTKPFLIQLLGCTFLKGTLLPLASLPLFHSSKLGNPLSNKSFPVL